MVTGCGLLARDLDSSIALAVVTLLSSALKKTIFNTKKVMLRPLDHSLWVCEKPFRFLVTQIESRMTVIQLDDQRLFLHSPVKLDRALQAQLDEFGPVAFIVAPNRFHHLFVSDYRLAYPNAKLFIAPGLQKKRKDLKYDAILSDDAANEWSNEIDQLVFLGTPMLNEVVFFHIPSHTLILTDLAFNYHEISSPVLRIALRIYGAHNGFNSSRLIKLATRDRKKAQRDLARIADWDFKRVIVAHGEVLETKAKQTFIDAFSWIKK